jgi:hypothetical protein
MLASTQLPTMVRLSEACAGYARSRRIRRSRKGGEKDMAARLSTRAVEVLPPTGKEGAEYVPHLDDGGCEHAQSMRDVEAEPRAR